MNIDDIVNKFEFEKQFKEVGKFGGSGNYQNLLIYIPKETTNRHRYLMKKTENPSELRVYMKYKI